MNCSVFSQSRDTKVVGILLWGFVTFFWYYKGVPIFTVALEFPVSVTILGHSYSHIFVTFFLDGMLVRSCLVRNDRTNSNELTKRDFIVSIKPSSAARSRVWRILSNVLLPPSLVVLWASSWLYPVGELVLAAPGDILAA
jgi:hypothetical protein